MNPTPSSPLAPTSLDEARRQRRENEFLEFWVRRTVRRFRVSADQLQELRGAGQLGRVKGQREWEALPEDERTEDRRRLCVGRKIKDEVSDSWKGLRGDREMGKRASALAAGTHTTLEYEGRTFHDRIQDMRAHMNHEALAGVLHGSLGLESPEDHYINREQQELDRDRVQFAISRLESDDDRTLAHQLLIEGRSLTDACAAVGVLEKSRRTRTRKRLYRELRKHARAFASSLAARLPPGEDNGGASA